MSHSVFLTGTLLVGFTLFQHFSIMPATALTGKRILVTGGGRGIGRAIARICHEEGAKVAIVARSKDELAQTAEGTTMETIGCDLTDETQVNDMVNQLKEKWEGLDILINNAGAGQTTKGPVASLKSEDLRNLLDLNVVAVHTVTSNVLQKMSPHYILNVSSRAGKIGIPNNAFYVASKFALEGYTASLASELKDKCLVNSISPGMVDTKSFPKAPGKPGVRTAESIRDGLLYMLSLKSTTGHYLHVDELDKVRQMSLPDEQALKTINEATFPRAPEQTCRNQS